MARPAQSPAFKHTRHITAAAIRLVKADERTSGEILNQAGVTANAVHQWRKEPKRSPSLLNILNVLHAVGYTLVLQRLPTPPTSPSAPSPATKPSP